MADAPIRVTGPINAAGSTMTLETGKLAPQADGAVLVQVGDTTLLSTVVTSEAPRGHRLLPAHRRRRGADVRRRARSPAASSAVRVARASPRSSPAGSPTARCGPSFPEGFRNEVQVIATIMGADLDATRTTSLSINGASAALMVSGIPFDGPIGAVRLSRHGSEWIAHPTFEESAESTFELVVAGRMIESGDIAIMMVEAGGTEATWRLYEEGAPKVDRGGRSPTASKRPSSGSGVDRAPEGARAAVVRRARPDRPNHLRGPHRLRRRRVRRGRRAGHRRTRRRRWRSPTRPSATTASTRSSRACCSRCAARPTSRGPFAARAPSQVKPAFRSLQKQVVRSRIVNEGLRIDGRGTTDIRPLSAEVELIPTAHGSGLFQRGETQVLSVLTLGMPRMEQSIGLDELRGTTKRYIHHYNFPPFSTGETGRVGLAEAPRDRPRRARRARAAAGRPVEGGVALRAARRLRRAQLERLHVDGVGVRFDALAARRRRAAQGVGRRHRDGPRLRRGQVHDAHRHPRHRGRVRRHGLQGRRHARLRHRAAARHEDRRPPRRRARARRCSRPATPA